MNSVIPHLYISSYKEAMNNSLLKSNNITHIINLSQVDIQFPSYITYLYIDIDDYSNVPIYKFFDETNQFIMNAIASGGNVLVHCYAGISRSATIVLAYLIYVNKMTIDDALYLLRSARSIVDPNPGFIDQLIILDKITHGY